MCLKDDAIQCKLRATLNLIHTMSKALAGATGDNAATVEFLLSGLGTRLADSMREEMETVGKVTARDAEEAMGAVVAAIRRMEQAGELFLIVESDEEGAADG